MTVSVDGKFLGFSVRGCPQADGGATCRGCFKLPGTDITTEAMTKSVVNGRLNPDKIPCGVLQGSARSGMARLARLIGEAEVNSSKTL